MHFKFPICAECANNNENVLCNGCDTRHFTNKHLVNEKNLEKEGGKN